MQPPPRDQQGRTTPHDHPEIHDVDWMLRHIVEQWLVPDAVTGGRRLSSAAFSPSNDIYRGLSMSLERLVVDDGGSAEEWMPDTAVAVATLSAGAIREEEGTCVGWDPMPDDRSHCNVWGAHGKAIRRQLARRACWRVAPAGGD